MVVITSFLVFSKPTGSLNMICDFALKRYADIFVSRRWLDITWQNENEP